ncbi:hypothetical protein KAH94_05940 [bacterium]|nr:hypothetical protein [bacterium]
MNKKIVLYVLSLGLCSQMFGMVDLEFELLQEIGLKVENWVDKGALISIELLDENFDKAHTLHKKIVNSSDEKVKKLAEEVFKHLEINTEFIKGYMQPTPEKKITDKERKQIQKIIVDFEDVLDFLGSYVETEEVGEENLKKNAENYIQQMKKLSKIIAFKMERKLIDSLQKYQKIKQDRFKEEDKWFKEKLQVLDSDILFFKEIKKIKKIKRIFEDILWTIKKLKRSYPWADKLLEKKKNVVEELYKQKTKVLSKEEKKEKNKQERMRKAEKYLDKIKKIKRAAGKKDSYSKEQAQELLEKVKMEALFGYAYLSTVEGQKVKELQKRIKDKQEEVEKLIKSKIKKEI